MKKIVSSMSIVALLLVCLIFVGCQAEPQPEANAGTDFEEVDNIGIWKDATYTEDTTFDYMWDGGNPVTLTLVIAAEDKEITFTICTNKSTVAEALQEHNLIEGADGMYTIVNGMTADYNVDQTYWAFYENDAYANQGMDTTTIDPAVTYKLVRSK